MEGHKFKKTFQKDYKGLHMKIISDFALNLNSIEEFARVMVPEALTETFRIKGLET